MKPNSVEPITAKSPVIAAFAANATPSPITRPNGPMKA
ncbi:Uncharacterised protein [Vibrio cholerae]|nr:Uncharacterised protein [Vibrio cholerae]CSI77338.1 Uncharacterised protein [Vibrio cholerae]